MLFDTVSTLGLFWISVFAGSALAVPFPDHPELVGRATRDPCSTTLKRDTAALQAQAANDCWNKISSHVINGGNRNVIGTNTGAHFASVYYTKGINQDTTDVSKLASQVDSHIGIVQSGSGSSLKTMWLDTNLGTQDKQNPKHEQILKTLATAFKGKLYAKTDITAICTSAMKASFAHDAGLLKPGTFTVTAPNLGADVKVVLVGSSRINSCYPTK